MRSMPRTRVRVYVTDASYTAVPPRRKRPRGFVKLAGACLLLLVCFVYFGHHGHAHANTASPKVNKVSDARLAELSTSINGLINAQSKDTITVLATDITTGQSVSYGSQASYTAASTAKLLSAVYFLHLTETGQESLTEDLAGTGAKDLLDAMIINSDDTAWATINDELTHNGLADYSASIGFTEYNVTLNTMPASDIQGMLVKLYTGKLLNKADTSLLLGEMAQADYRDYIVAGTPAGDTVYHKAGLVDDNIHDAAIITKDGHALAVTLFTDGNGTYDAAVRTTLMQQVTAQLTAAFLP
jgi:beta-lactamase class A